MLNVRWFLERSGLHYAGLLHTSNRACKCGIAGRCSNSSFWKGRVGSFCAHLLLPRRVMIERICMLLGIMYPRASNVSEVAPAGHLGICWATECRSPGWGTKCRSQSLLIQATHDDLIAVSISEVDFVMNARNCAPIKTSHW